MPKAEEYTYRVFWSADDQSFVASVAEFPSLSCVGDSQTEALLGMTEVVSDALAILEEDGDKIPEPLGSKNFSGHLSLRIPPEEHRRIAIEAAEEGVSINQLISSRI